MVRMLILVTCPKYRKVLFFSKLLRFRLHSHIKSVYVMKFLFACLLDTISQHHSIILLRFALIWSKILSHIWYQSIMIVFGLRIVAEYHNHVSKSCNPIYKWHWLKTITSSDVKKRKTFLSMFFFVCVCIIESKNISSYQ